MGTSAKTTVARPLRWLLAATVALVAGIFLTTMHGAAEATAPTTGKKNVVLIVVDTLRGDAIDRANTPVLDGLAAAGQTSRAWAPGTWTAPSTLSLMSGSMVRRHGWDFPFPDKLPPDTSYPKVKDFPMLARVMHDGGYRTVGLYANPLLSRGLGWQRGFEVWERTSDARMIRDVRSALSDGDERPTFLYLHFKGPHQPLKPKEAYIDAWNIDRTLLRKFPKGYKRKHVRVGNRVPADEYFRAYHAVVEETDHRLGRLLEALGEPYKDALIIVTSDHGEMLGEHGVFGHGSYVWEGVSRVPLYVRGTSISLPPVMSTSAIADLITRTTEIAHTWPESVAQQDVLVTQREGKVAMSETGIIRHVWDDPNSSAVHIYETDGEGQEAIEHLDLSSRADAQMLRFAWESTVPHRDRPPATGPIDDETRALLKELGYMEPDDAD